MDRLSTWEDALEVVGAELLITLHPDEPTTCQHSKKWSECVQNVFKMWSFCGRCKVCGMCVCLRVLGGLPVGLCKLYKLP